VIFYISIVYPVEIPRSARNDSCQIAGKGGRSGQGAEVFSYFVVK